MKKTCTLLSLLLWSIFVQAISTDYDSGCAYMEMDEAAYIPQIAAEYALYPVQPLAVEAAKTVTLSPSVDRVFKTMETDPPYAGCQDVTVDLNAGGTGTLLAATVNNGSSDAGSGINTSAFSVTPNTFECASIASNPTEVTLTVEDNDNNQSTCKASVTVRDMIDPTALCKDLTVQLDNAGNGSITANQVNNGSNDACDNNLGLAVAPMNFDCSDVSASPVSVTLTATDQYNNWGTCTANVDIFDNIPPTTFCGVADVENPVFDNNIGSAFNITSKYAQTFKPNHSISLKRVAIRLRNTVTPGDMTLSLYAGTDPNSLGVPLDQVTISNLSFAFNSFVYFDFPGTNLVSAGQDLILVLETTGQYTMTFSTNNAYANGTAHSQFDPNPFFPPQAGSYDFSFMIYTPSLPLCVDLNAAGQANISESDINPGGSQDACGMMSITVSPNTFACANISSNPHTVTLIATDNNGNQASCTAGVKVKDVTAPTVLCKDVTLQLDANGSASLPTSDVHDSSSDNCSSTLSFELDKGSYNCADIGPNTVTLFANDLSGNSGSCTANVLIEDNEGPIIQHLICGTSDATGVEYADGWQSGDKDGSGFGLWSLSTSASNSSEGGFFRGDSRLNGSPGGVVNDPNVDGDINTGGFALGMYANSGATTIATRPFSSPFGVKSKFTLEFDNGNIDPGNGISVEMLNSTSNLLLDVQFFGGTSNYRMNDLSGTSTFTSIGFTDQGLILEIVLTTPTTAEVTLTRKIDNVSQTLTAELIQPISGTQEISAFVVINANAGSGSDKDLYINNMEVCYANNGCPANISVANDAGQCGAVIDYDEVQACDACDGILSVTQTMGQASGTSFPVGTTTNTFSAQDSRGNTASCSFTVTVTDNEPLEAKCKDITVYLDNSGNASIVGTDIDDGSSDNCGIASLVPSKTSFDCGDEGPDSPPTVTLTVTDNNSNQATCTAAVEVDDIMPPHAGCKDITVQLDATGNVTILDDDVENGSSDNCNQQIPTNVTPESFTCSDIGNNIVTLRVGDRNGNRNTCTATVTVEDVTGPVMQTPVCGTISNAAAAAYNNGWQAGDNDGSGFGPWSFDPSSNSSEAGFFVGEAATNGSSVFNGAANDSNGDNDIDSNGKALGLYANSGQKARAERSFSTPLGKGSVLKVDIDNGFIDNGKDIEFILRSTTNLSSIIVFMQGGDTYYKLLDANGSTTFTNIPYTDQGIHIEVTNLGGDQYEVELTRLEDGVSQSIIATPAGGSGLVIGGIWLINGTAGMGTSNNLYINNMEICHPANGCPANVSVTNDAGACGAVVDYEDVLAFDACEGCLTVVQTTGQASGTLFPVGTTTNTFTATDSHGNTSACSFTVEVTDDTDPTALCQDLTVSVDDNGQVNIAATDVAVANSANDFLGTQGNNGWEYGMHAAFDLDGFTQLPNFTGFVWNNPGTNLGFPQIDANGGHPQIENQFWAVRRWTSSVTGMVRIEGDFFDRDNNCGDGAHVRIFRNGAQVYEYLNVPTTSTTYTITVPVVAGDKLSFAIDPKFDSSCDDTHFTAEITLLGLASTIEDECGPLTISATQSTFDCSDIGPLQPVGLTVEDPSGNSTTCTAQVRVIDAVKPVALCKDVTVELDANGVAAIIGTQFDNGSSDNCGITSYRINGFEVASLNCGQLPASPLTTDFTVYDAAGNISPNCEVSITLEDNLPPTITCPTGTLRRNTDPGVCTHTVVGTDLDPLPIADNCQLASVINDYNGSNTLAGEVLPKGKTTVTWTATDASGNSTTCTYDIRIRDREAPVFDNCPQAASYVVPFCSTGHVHTWPTLTATDNCTRANRININVFPLSGSFFPLGTTTVNATATDKAGNVGDCVFTVTVTEDCDPLPVGMTNGDIGNTGNKVGRVCYDATTKTYEIKTSGSGIASAMPTTDGFHYVCLSSTDMIMDVRARIVQQPTNNYRDRVGVMIRQNHNANAASVSTLIAGDNKTMLVNRASAGMFASAVHGPTLPGPIWPGPVYWVRLHKIGAFYYSYVSPDGVNWTMISAQSNAIMGSYKVGIAATAGTPGQVIHYKVDNFTVNGTAYRVGGDGLQAMEVSAFPNPVKNSLNVVVNAPNTTDARLSLSNALGQELIVHTYQVDEMGIINRQIEMEGLAAGVYLLEVRTDTETKTIKVVKK